MSHDDLTRALRGVPAYQRFLAAFAIGLAASCSAHAAAAPVPAAGPDGARRPAPVAERQAPSEIVRPALVGAR